MRGRRHSLKWARPCLIPLTLLLPPRWRSLPLPKSPRLKWSRRSRPISARTIPPRHIPARWWILPPPVTRRQRKRKRRSSRSRLPKRTRPLNPAEADRPRMARLLPIRQSSPNLGTKSPKVSLPRRILSWIRAALPPVRRSRRSHLRPVTPLDRQKRRLSISTCPICIRSKITPLVFGTMRKCRGLWSRSRRQASISLRWCVPVRMAAMRSSQATAASGQVSLPDLRICLVSSAT